MKILFAIDTLGSGGKERRLTELLKALKASNDFEFELAVMDSHIHYREILDLDLRIHMILRKTKRDLSAFSKFWKLIREYKPDLVHCWDSMTAIYLAPVCKLMHCKLINGMVIDSPLQQNMFNKYWLRARVTFPFSKIIVGNSEAGLKAYGAPNHKSIVVYPGFNFSRTENLPDRYTVRTQLDINTDAVVGMIATFWEKKDYPTFFNAAQKILTHRRDVTFVAVGSGTDSQEAHDLIESQNRSFFKLLGRRSDVEALVKMMDICVLSTFTEGTPNSILEYMALGKPVIASNGGGTCEIVADGETGFLVEPSDPLALAEKIELLLNDQQLRKKMGTAGLERVTNIFSINKMVSNYMNIYARLMSS